MTRKISHSEVIYHAHASINLQTKFELPGNRHFSLDIFFSWLWPATYVSILATVMQTLHKKQI